MLPTLPPLFQKFLLFAIVAFFFVPAKAQVNVDLSPPLISGLNQPMQFISANDGSNRIFIPQKEGVIKVYSNSYVLLDTLVTVTGMISSGEQGLLSLVFHPDFTTNGLFFVYHNNAAGNLVLARYKISSGNANKADIASRVEVLEIPHPGQTNHNGGELHFGADGYLYLSTGDGGGGGDPSNNSQNDNVLLGKILRLNVNASLIAPYYTVPVGNPNGTLVFSKGLRNPYRWSFDRETNDMWIGDVGQNSWEEINFRAAANTAGTNYGWRCYEGNATYNTTGCGPSSNYLFPVYTYVNGPGSVSVTGGNVYRGSSYPTYKGHYLAADFYTGEYYHIVPNGAGGFNTSIQSGGQTGLVDFGEDEQGEVYAVSLTASAVYRVIPRSVVPVSLTSFNGIVANNKADLFWKTEQESAIKNYEIEFSNNGTLFNKIGTIAARNSNKEEQYNFTHNQTQSDWQFYRLKINNADGSYKYSAVIKVQNTKPNKGNFVQPSVIENGLVQIYLPESFTKVEIINSTGARVAQKNISSTTGLLQLPVGHLPAGIYLVRLSNKNNFLQQKIIIQ